MNERRIYVAATNIQGIPGAGTAKVAKLHHGLRYGVSQGFCGNTYAICTKDLHKGKRSVPLEFINEQVQQLKIAAAALPDVPFDVPAIGCGLAGFSPHEIAPMFKDSPPNMNLPLIFKEILNS